MKQLIAALTFFVALFCSTPSYAGFADNSDDTPSWKQIIDGAGGGFGGSGLQSLGSIRTASTSSSFGDFRAFFLGSSASTCTIGFEIPGLPLLVIITTKEGLGSLLDTLLDKIGGLNPDGPTLGGDPIDGPTSGGPGGGGPGGGGGVAAVPEPATLAVWGLLGLVSTGAGYRRLRRKSA